MFHRGITVEQALRYNMFPVITVPLAVIITTAITGLRSTVGIRIRTTRFFGIHIQQGTVIFIIMIDIGCLVTSVQPTITIVYMSQADDVGELCFQGIARIAVCRIIITGRDLRPCSSSTRYE
ncbi:hypothetical protein D3C86_1133120 [compost metagenome]